jgi:hypothetical protein
MDGDARSASDDARKVASGQPHLLHPEPDGIDWVWRIDFESVEYPWIFYAPILGSRHPDQDQVLHHSFQGAVDRLYSYQYSIRVSKDEPLPIVFYRTSGGDEPVRDWLLFLPADARKEIGGDIRNVQDGWPLGKVMSS